MRGVFKLSLAADISDDDRPGLNAYPRAPEPELARQRAASNLFGNLQNGERAFQSAPWVVGQFKRSIEDRDDAVANDLLHHAAMLQDDIGQRIEIFVEQCDQLACL